MAGSGAGQDRVEVAGVPALFRTSSRSSDPVDCVEVADPSQGTALRDSKCPMAGHLTFSAGEWDAFLTAAH